MTFIPHFYVLTDFVDFTIQLFFRNKSDLPGIFLFSFVPMPNIVFIFYLGSGATCTKHVFCWLDMVAFLRWIRSKYPCVSRLVLCTLITPSIWFLTTVIWRLKCSDFPLNRFLIMIKKKKTLYLENNEKCAQ